MSHNPALLADIPANRPSATSIRVKRGFLRNLARDVATTKGYIRRLTERLAAGTFSASPDIEAAQRSRLQYYERYLPQVESLYAQVQRELDAMLALEAEWRANYEARPGRG